MCIIMPLISPHARAQSNVWNYSQSENPGQPSDESERRIIWVRVRYIICRDIEKLININRISREYDLEQLN